MIVKKKQKIEKKIVEDNKLARDVDVHCFEVNKGETKYVGGYGE